MTQEQPSYLAYLLRLWSAPRGNAVNWRASLESPSSDQPRGFPSLDDLFDYLRTQTEMSSREGEER